MLPSGDPAAPGNKRGRSNVLFQDGTCMAICDWRNALNCSLPNSRNVPVALVSLLLATGCTGTRIAEMLRSETPHERYVERLHQIGLDQTALGGDWIETSIRVLEEAVEVRAPYEEVSYLDPSAAHARGYRLSLRRGQRLTTSFELKGDTTYQVFLDLFLKRDSTSRPILVSSADSLSNTLDYVIRRNGEYVLRIQPELLRGGQYVVTVKTFATLAFPVSGSDTTAIQSVFGDSRDGGRRNHHGVDIFAPRGTPVVAAARGAITSTRDNRLGGKVIWLRDDLGRRHYYAHLDARLVARGRTVEAGDTIGLVGNTGNARTTRPHLHFGIYERGVGPSDPYPALYQPPTDAGGFRGDPAVIGSLVRVSRSDARLRGRPSDGGQPEAELPLYTQMRVEGGTGNWYRVRLPDGTHGYVVASATESADQPIETTVAAAEAPLLSGPTGGALETARVGRGEELPVYGRFGIYLYVATPRGQLGWLSF